MIFKNSTLNSFQKFGFLICAHLPKKKKITYFSSHIVLERYGKNFFYSKKGEI